MPSTPAKTAKALSDKQSAFVREYLVDFNATQAAIRAGYSENTAGVIGFENLKKPYIRQAIDQRLSDLGLSAEETIKLLADIARGSLNDYFLITTELVEPWIEKPLRQVIKELESEIDFEDEVADQLDLADAALDAHAISQKRRQIDLVRLQVELRRNPQATRIVKGAPRLVETAVLDLPRLVRDKERGRIKSISYGPNGPKVELYAADAALVQLGRVHGIFEEDNRQKGIQIVNVNGTPPPQRENTVDITPKEQ